VDPQTGDFLERGEPKNGYERQSIHLTAGPS
jgi:hypothetical protein